jgi:hypothetical protein
MKNITSIIKIFLLVLIYSPTTSFSQQYDFVELNQGNMPQISDMIMSHVIDFNYRYEFNSTASAPNGFATYETTTSESSYHSSKEIIRLNPNGSLADYTFNIKDNSSYATSRRSTGNIYPPYSSSCKSKNTYVPVLGRANGTISSIGVDHTHYSECIPNTPLAPQIINTTTRIDPAVGYGPSTMKPINCTRNESWSNPYIESYYSAISVGSSEYTETATLALWIGGDPTLQYYISFDVVAEDLDNVTGSPQPTRVDETTVGGGNGENSSYVEGWFPGDTMMPVSVKVNSKCYAYGIGNFTLRGRARRAR